MEPVHDFLKNKWYFDELIDALVYRPVIRAGRFANDVVERVVVQGIVGGTTGAVARARAPRPRGPVRLRPRLRAARARRLRRARPLFPGGELVRAADAELPALDAARRRAGRRVAPQAASPARSRPPGRWSTLGLAIALVRDFDSATPGLQHVVDEAWIPELGVRYQLGVDGISLFLVAMTALLWAASCFWSAFRAPDRAKNYFLMLGPRRVRDARRLPGAGPAALRPVLRPDAGAVLLPDRLLRHRRPRAGDDQDDGLHAGRVAADAGRRRSRRRCSRQDQSGELSFAMADLRANVLPEGSQDWIFCFFAAAFLVKMPAFPLHGWMPDAYLAAPPAGPRAALGRPLEGRRLRLPAGRPADLPRRDRPVPGADPGDRRRSRSSTARRWRSPRPTCG